MQKPWLNSYSKGVPENISLDEFNSVADIIDNSIKNYADHPAFSNFGTVITYRQLGNYTDQLAAYLKDELGLAKGARVAIMMPNLLQYPIAIFAVLRAGFVVVNTNPLYTARELKHQMNDSGAEAIILVENFCSLLAEIIDDTSIKHVIITQLGDMLKFPKSDIMNLVSKHVKKMVPAYHLPDATSFKKALKRGSRHHFVTVKTEHHDIALLQYTGGTTGVSKGAILTNKNLVANILQCSAWIADSIQGNKGTIITALPLYHIFSLTANCLLLMKHGWLNYLITNPRDLQGMVKELKKVRFEAITGVNTLFNGLLNNPEFKKLDFSHLKMSLSGGMPVHSLVAEKWKAVTGVTLIEAYGLTESSPAACMNPMELESFNGMIGLPISSTEISIQDDLWNALGIGQIGEICIRGPQVMRGYWQRPEESAGVLSDDGWLHTGDIGIMDEKGFIKIVDRKKDMILVSGFNVFPNEIESFILEHPGVEEVGVFGKSDEKTGESVVAVVVKKDTSLTEHDLKAFCHTGLTNYKIPKQIIFADELPKSNVSKILRRELRDKYSNYHK